MSMPSLSEYHERRPVCPAAALTVVRVVVPHPTEADTCPENTEEERERKRKERNGA